MTIRFLFLAPFESASLSYFFHPVSMMFRKHRHHEDNADSSASIRSTDTNTSLSSQSSRSSSPNQQRDYLGNLDTHDLKISTSHNKGDNLQFLLVVLGDRLDVDNSSWHGYVWCTP